MTTPAPRRKAPRLPFAPIEALIAARHTSAGKRHEAGETKLRELARLIGKDPATIRRWRQSGITIDVADDLACRFTKYPACLVWGAEWWRVVVIPDLAEMAGDPALADLVEQGDEWDIADLLDLIERAEVAA